MGLSSSYLIILYCCVYYFCILCLDNALISYYAVFTFRDGDVVLNPILNQFSMMHRLSQCALIGEHHVLSKLRGCRPKNQDKDNWSILEFSSAEHPPTLSAETALFHEWRHMPRARV